MNSDWEVDTELEMDTEDGDINPEKNMVMIHGKVPSGKQVFSLTLVRTPFLGGSLKNGRSPRNFFDFFPSKFGFLRQEKLPLAPYVSPHSGNWVLSLTLG